MSPSINELFSAPGSEAEDDFELDMDKLMQGVDQSLKESTRFAHDETEPEPTATTEPPAEEPEPVSPSGDPGQIEPTADEPQPVGEAGAEERPGESTAEIPPPVVDPLGLLFAEAAQDPAKRDRLLAALRDPEPQAQIAPTLPDDIEEGTVAARLWHDNQKTQADLARIAAGQQQQAEAIAQQRAAQAATEAGNEFAARYEGKLDGDDVVRIAQTAGSSGLAARLAAGNDDLKGAYLQALESTLWTEPTLRAKVLDPTTPTEPTPAQADAAQSSGRKRKLTALSSAASPTSAPAERRSPLETRTDGKLTPQSRLSVVGELAGKLAKDRTEGMF